MMNPIKLSFLLFVLLTGSFSIVAQSVQYVYTNAQTQTVQTYQPKDKTLWLPMSFGKSSIQSIPPLLDSLKTDHFEVLEVSIVYSDYPKGINFHGLNQSRLAALQKLLPSIFTESKVSFHLIKQTACTTKAEAERLPHGISIQYWEFSREENASMITQTIESPKPTSIEEPEEVTKEVEQPSINITSSQIGPDSTVLVAVNRNAHQWQGKWVIITDLTYSMEPFTWQILQWQQAIREKQSVIAHVFFNDGDKTKDADKLLGATHGIYDSQSSNPDSLIRLMEQVQQAGNGGDIPENDMEVLRFAQQKYKDAEVYVLIADAKSSIRDFELLKEINKPVKVILARTENSYHSIPLQYIELALATEGSVHTLYKDFNTPAELLSVKAYHEEQDRYYKAAEGKKGKGKRKKKGK